MPKSKMFQFQWSIPADGFQWLAEDSVPAIRRSSPSRTKSGVSPAEGVIPD